MSLPQMPLSVIGGYLGSGKTTLINRILEEDHGLRLMILVNDFGAINIDKELLVSSDEDTLTLTNGCVCCTMGADLFMAIGRVLDRVPRPDHLIIEASGIADPARIADVAKAEPELCYRGIVTVVDGKLFNGLSSDRLIGPQICSQVSCSDLIFVSKLESLDEALSLKIGSLTSSPVILSDEVSVLNFLLLDGEEKRLRVCEKVDHPSYSAWFYEGEKTYSPKDIKKKLLARPSGIFRLKGVFRDPEGTSWSIQVVGTEANVTKTPIRQASDEHTTSIVAIGLKESFSVSEIDAWWNSSSSLYT